MANILSLISVCLQDDKTFTTTLNLRLHGNLMVEDELYQVVKTCHYPNWASREIVCDRGYMEASECSRTLRGHVTVYISGFISHQGCCILMTLQQGEGEIYYHLGSGLISRCL